MSQQHVQGAFVKTQGVPILQLYLSAHNLPDSKVAKEGKVANVLTMVRSKKQQEKAVNSLRADSFVVVSVDSKPHSTTPIVEHNANPVYPISIEVDISKDVDICFCVMDYHKSRDSVQIGTVTVKASLLADAPGGVFKHDINGIARPEGNGSLEVKVEALRSCGIVSACIAASNLPRIDIKGTVDAYFLLSSSADGTATGQGLTHLYASEVRVSNNPWWTRMVVPLYKLNPAHKLRFLIMDKDQYSEDDPAGEVVVGVTEFLALALHDDDWVARTSAINLGSSAAHQLIMNSTKSSLVIQSVVVRNGPVADGKAASAVAPATIPIESKLVSSEGP